MRRREEADARGMVASRPVEDHMPIYGSEDQEPGLPPDLHAAWERAGREERLLFLGRPDVLAAAMELLRHGRREGVA